MANEDLVLDGYALTNERVRGNLAAGANRRLFLDLDKGANLRIGPDRATIKVDQIGLEDLHAFSQRYVRRYWQKMTPV